MKEKAKTEEERPMGNKREGERGERVRERIMGKTRKEKVLT